jgi:hypothetical protein
MAVSISDEMFPGTKYGSLRSTAKVIAKNADTARCDYLLLNDEAKRAYYIELKGSDLEKAIQQIEATVQMFQTSLPGYTTYRRIIYFSGTTDIRGSAVQRWKAKHRTAVIKLRVLSEAIS